MVIFDGTCSESDLTHPNTSLRHGSGIHMSTCEVTLKGIDLGNLVGVCTNHMDRVLVALSNGGGYMNRCATVFKGEGRGIQSTKVSNIIREIDYGPHGLDEW
jgi:hypothetical protein